MRKLKCELLEGRDCPSVTVPTDSYIPIEQFSPAATGNPDTATPPDYRTGSWVGTSTR